MTISRYGRMDDTGNEGMLRMWYNPFPVKWFDTDLFYADWRGVMGADNSFDNENEMHRILSYNKIIMLDRMLKMMSMLMQNVNERNLFSLVFGRKPKAYEGNLSIYIEKVKYITGIEVKDGNDLKKLQKEVQRLLDKYNENFKAPEKQEKVDFIELVMGVFSIMEMAYAPQMTLSEFAKLRKLAVKKVKPKDGKPE